MIATIHHKLFVASASVCMLVAASGAHAVTDCKGAVEVLGHSLRLVPYDKADLSVKARYSALDARPDRSVVITANGTVHHSRDGESRTTHFQFFHQFGAGSPHVAEQSQRVAVSWCSDKSPCRIDKVEATRVSCSVYAR